jgi:hypothetical protein
MAPVTDSCAVVPRHLTVELAHNILHIHRTCPPDQCLRRKAALYFLMDSHRARQPTGGALRRAYPPMPGLS